MTRVARLVGREPLVHRVVEQGGGAGKRAWWRTLCGLAGRVHRVEKEAETLVTCLSCLSGTALQVSIIGERIVVPAIKTGSLPARIEAMTRKEPSMKGLAIHFIACEFLCEEGATWRPLLDVIERAIARQLHD